MNTTPGPHPLASWVKMPSELKATGACMGSLEPAGVVTTILAAWPTIRLVGTCALICVGETYSKGIAIPLTVAEVPPSVTGSG